MILLDLINLKKIQRALLYTMFLALILLLQHYFLARVRIFGTKLLLVPLVIVGIGMLEDGFWGGLFGLIAGVLCDMAASNTTVFFTICFTLMGFVSGLGTHTAINRSEISYLFFSFLSMLALAFLQGLHVCITRDAHVLDVLRTGVLQTVLSTTAGCWFFPVLRRARNYQA